MCIACFVTTSPDEALHLNPHQHMCVLLHLLTAHPLAPPALPWPPKGSQYRRPPPPPSSCPRTCSKHAQQWGAGQNSRQGRIAKWKGMCRRRQGNALPACPSVKVPLAVCCLHAMHPHPPTTRALGHVIRRVKACTWNNTITCSIDTQNESF